MYVQRGLMIVTALVAAAFTVNADAQEKGTKNVDTRVFEMRTYYAHPGKMSVLHERFRKHTCKLFDKHGMTLIGFWSPSEAKEAEKKMVYILAFPSRAAAQKSWDAFRNDPDWKAAKDASEKDGPLVMRVVSEFLDPTDYSPLK